MTPGPWIVYDCQSGARRVLRIRAGARSGGTVISEVGPVGDPRAEADAHAIGCVPDLVDVVQDLVERLDRLGDTEPMRLRGESFAAWDAKQRRARDVLARARRAA